MLSTDLVYTETEGETVAVGNFQFISIQSPDQAKDHVMRRVARSHAVKKALENKRKLQKESRENFRVITVQNKPRNFTRRRTPARTAATSLFSPSLGMLDPFQTLGVSSSRLQTLLGDYRGQQAAEPVFIIAEELDFHSFRSVFRTGLVDPALLSAVMLSLSFAVADASINRECLWYQGQAISYVRERMSSLSEATSESTIGAILLLAGVEARLGMTSQVQLHMEAVRRLLKICHKEGVYLTTGIKRAVFWQDLNSSVLAGSSRIVDHTTFSELYWARDSSPSSLSWLPPGFQIRSHLFTRELIEVLEDLHALQCIRNTPPVERCDAKMMARINNHIASIQSRLVNLPGLSPIMSCCRLAAYLCSSMLCCKPCCVLVIPPYISSQLFHELQRWDHDSVWSDHPDLLLWLLFIGGAFAPIGTIRSNYSALLRSNKTSRFGGIYKSWPELLEIFEQFIWSEQAFMPQCKAFWEETFTSVGLCTRL